MNYFKRTILIPVLSVFFFLDMFAQNEILFDPASLIPHEDGYYIGGVYLDLNDDGQDEFYNECIDSYENPLSPQDNHHESGTQQDFTYINCMIMPTCTHKGTPIEPPVPVGYIQMAPSLYLGTDSASISAVFTPSLINMQSITIETSADVSINDTRKIPYTIDYSKDSCKTWEVVFIQDYVAAQGGYRVTYTSESNLDFKYMADASKEGSIIVRISTNDVSVDRPNKGQYVKIHSVKIVADQVLSSREIIDENYYENLIINDKTVISKKYLTVYNTQGQLIGSGKIISLPVNGIYIVMFPDGISQKIVIQ